MADETRALTFVHEKVGHTMQGLWHHKAMQLPAYLDIQHIANDLISERAMPESVAIATAISMCKKWAAGGKDVHPDTRAKAAAAIAEWERLRVQAHAVTAAKRTVMDDDMDRAQISTADINNLPDEAFAYIEPGGKKDASGKTIPRSLRHFPVHDAAHVRNALARAPQSPFGDRAMSKIRARAKELGIGQPAENASSGSASRGVPSELFRFYPLEDIHVLTRAEGDGSGTLVEAYATVFDESAEIIDHQGHYFEVIDRGAFDDTLAKIRRSRGGFPAHIKVLYNHGKTCEGQPAPEFQLPLGVPVDVIPERRGLLTRTRYDTADPFTERILGKIRTGAINTQSFVGGIIRSDPALMGPGDKYRGRGGKLTTVRRMVLGLREYGPVLWPAYSGAEILGVRMSIPGSSDDPAEEAKPYELPDTPADEENDPAVEGPVAAAARAEADPSRHHQHALYALRSREMREKAGIDF